MPLTEPDGRPDPDESQRRVLDPDESGRRVVDPDESGRRVVDPDVDLHDPVQRRELSPHRWDLLAAVAIGGVVGAEARYALGLAVSHSGGQFPWSTVLINVTGCLLIGILMATLQALPRPHRLLRPFLGVGVLGGYTTFSTFATDVHRLLLAHRPLVALGYLLTTVLGCAAAVRAGTAVSQGVVRRARVAVGVR